MGTHRSHIRIARPVTEVWAVVSDPCSVERWMPGIQACACSDGVRRVTLSGVGEVTETIFASDSGLHQFQYGLEPLPAPLTYHRATLDVIEDPIGSLVVYSVDVQPDEMAAALGQVYGSALECLRDVIEAD